MSIKTKNRNFLKKKTSDIQFYYKHCFYFFILKDMEAERFIKDLSKEVHNRLHDIGMKGRTVTLKLMVRREDAPLETAKFMGT